ncbi:uncharacterized protein LOC141718447 [Apium graveolens]|uniref:uncharacterized protein LOC141704238 n=1 Tax=Apium graveolens TaxID=4045 RepID=UPI003D7B61A6
MTEKGNTWLNLPKYTKGYMDGVKLYMKKAMANFGRGEKIKCPCRKCENRLWWGGSDVERHLIWSGPSPLFIQSIYDVSLLADKTDNVEFEHNTRFGDNLDDMLDVIYSDVGPNDDARKFYRLVDEGKQPLYPGFVNYNRPPWLNIKPENLILSTSIPGPNDPGNNIDVYIQPLIEELKELWKKGVETYNAATNQKFKLRASVLWTISDFPGYAMMSGWSTKGKLACPVCHYETSSMYFKHSKKLCYMNHRKFLDPNHKWRFDKRRFNGEVETGTSAPMLTGRQVAEILDGYENSFGGVGKKRKVSCDINPWNKKSIFFDLPYWKDNLTWHNLDVMHIEKNICDSVLGTLLNIGGKTKDHLAARLDL